MTTSLFKTLQKFSSFSPRRSILRNSLSISSLKPFSWLNKIAITAGLLLGLFSSTSYAALSATTANTIQGSEPYLVLNGVILSNTDELLGFLMPDGSGGKRQIKATDAGSNINIVTGTKFSDIELLIIADNTNYSLNSVTGLVVSDNDGDASGGVGSATGNMQAVFKEGTTPITNLNQVLNSCGGPYTLTVTTTGGVQAQTPFGAPNIKFYTNNTVTYTLIPQGAGICYIETGDMTEQWGFNNTVWTTGKGFHVTNLKKTGIDFPTTGFQGAKLTVMGSGTNQSLYQCDISGGTWATNTGGNGCTLTYTNSGRPTGNITVRLKTNDAAATVLDSYIIKVPTLWAESGDPSKTISGYTNNSIPYNQNSNFSGRYLAAESCGLPANTNVGNSAANQATAATYFFTSTQLTNFAGTSGNFSRDADSSFMGEWGVIHNYSSSPWLAAIWYWVGEAGSPTRQMIVNTTSGSLFIDIPDIIGGMGVACKR